MVLEKGSFGQMPIVQPQKMGSFGQDTQVRHSSIEECRFSRTNADRPK